MNMNTKMVELTQPEIIALEEFLYDVAKERSDDKDLWRQLHSKIYKAAYEEKLRVNACIYNKQLGAIATAMAEMDDNSPKSFEKFLNRMVSLGVIER